MTILDVTPVAPETDLAPPVHIVCCLQEEFLCGAPYHPEMVADHDNAPDADGICPECGDVVEASACHSPTIGLHFHCVVTDRICPMTFKGG